MGTAVLLCRPPCMVGLRHAERTARIGCNGLHVLPLLLAVIKSTADFIARCTIFRRTCQANHRHLGTSATAATPWCRLRRSGLLLLLPLLLHHRPGKGEGAKTAPAAFLKGSRPS